MEKVWERAVAVVFRKFNFRRFILSFFFLLSGAGT